MNNIIFLDNRDDVASAIKKTAEGKSLTLTDVSPLQHKISCKLTSDTYEEIIDGSSNIYQFNSENMSISDMSGSQDFVVEHTINSDGTITLNGYSNDAARARLQIKLSGLTSGQIYTYSLRANNAAQDNITKSTFAIIPYKNGSPVVTAITQNGGKNYITFTALDECDYYIVDYIYWNRWEDVYEGNPYNNLILYPQLELGNTMTDWSEYIEEKTIIKPYVEDFSTVIVNINGIEYIPTSDGSLSITSTYPDMQISTNNEYVNINITYNTDISKYLEDVCGVGKATSEGGEIFNTYEGDLLNKATGEGAHAEGRGTEAGRNAHSEGKNTKALGNASHAEGNTTVASGDGGSHAEGMLTVASGLRSHAEGYDAKAEGEHSHAEGSGTVASGKSAHAEGENTTAKGDYAHASGSYTQANGNSSHAAGYGTIANKDCQFVVGSWNTNKDTTLFEVGNGSEHGAAYRSNAFEVYKDGHAEVQRVGTTNNSVATRKFVLENMSSGLTREVVSELPEVGNKDTIYMVRNESNEEQNIYDEYLFINGKYELIGSTKVDLSNYYNIEQVDNKLLSKQDKFADVTIEGLSGRYTLNSAKKVTWNTQEGISIINDNIYDGKISLLNADTYAGVEIGAKNNSFTIAEYGIYRSNESPASRVNVSADQSELTSNYHGFIVSSGVPNLMDSSYSNVIIDKASEKIRLHTDEIIVGKKSEITSTANVPGIISNIATPTANDHAVNKKYVDDVTNSLDNVLRDILTAIQSGESAIQTVEAIEQLIVSYLENKDVLEVEE